MTAPLATVVVPTRDRPAGLARCLAALAAQVASGLVEIVVADDGSRDADGVARLAARTPGARVLRLDGGGPAAARNAGARDAAAPVVLFCDDDCAPTPTWAGALAGALESGAGAAIGRTVAPRDARATTRAWHAIVDHLVEAGHDPGSGTVAFGPSCNLAVRTDLARAVPFDDRFPLAAGEDRDWCARVVAAGERLVLAPDAVVVHHQDLGVGGFLRQQARYGRGAARFRAADPSERRIAAPSFYTGLLRRGLRAGPAAGALVLAAQAATAWGIATERAARRGPASHPDPERPT